MSVIFVDAGSLEHRCVSISLARVVVSWLAVLSRSRMMKLDHLVM